MKIVADKAIPYARQFFSTLGDVTLLHCSDITPASVRDADCLVVRSVTRVDHNLLGDTRIKCVASASSGTDHVDLDCLNARAIPLFDAKGCNANAVAEYVLSCLFVLSEQYGLEPDGKTAGIIGCGHVGARLRYLLNTTGLETRIYDPFIRDENGCFIFRDLESVLSADIITLHVPMTTTGEYPTAQMVDRRFLGRLKRDVILINTARGGVVHEQDLIDFARRNRASHLVLDVWKNEPCINNELFGLASLATPHIAGYSARARLNATRLVHEKVCKLFDVHPSADAVTNRQDRRFVRPQAAVRLRPGMGAVTSRQDRRFARPQAAVRLRPGMGAVTLPDEGAELDLSGFEEAPDAIRTAVLAAYDVRSDCAALREIEDVEPASRGDFFTSLRTDYPFRREFSEMQVVLPENQGSMRDRLSSLGFGITS